MPFTIRPSRHFPGLYAVSYNAGLFQGQGTVWNSSAPIGNSPVVCLSDQGKRFLSLSRSRTSKGSKSPKPWCSGHKVRSLGSRRLRLRNIHSLD
jgi:hypothetical protein